MSQFPPLKAPDGFELGVFSRMMLSQLPLAIAPSSFETNVLEKSTDSQIRPQIRSTVRRNFNWKASLASFALLATLVSVGLFTGVLDTNVLGHQSDAAGQTMEPSPQQQEVQTLPVVDPAATDIKKADQQTKRGVVKRGNRALINGKKVVAGH